jgi:hypothetical protein
MGTRDPVRCFGPRIEDKSGEKQSVCLDPEGVSEEAGYWGSKYLQVDGRRI